MSKPILRKYSLQDEAMLVKAETILNLLTTELPDFTALFPTIDSAFFANLQASINTANAIALDNSVSADISVLTADVNLKVAEGYKALQTLNTYAKLTYPNDEARRQVFGQKHWQEAISDQEKMMNALEMAHAKAETDPYKTDLSATGYNLQAGLLAIAQSIRALNLLQESAIANRPVATQDRIVAYNTVWGLLQTLNIASKEVYKDNPAKLEQYLLYPGSQDSTEVRIIVNGQLSGNPIAGATVLLANTTLASQLTNAQGEVAFASINMPDLVDVEISKGNLSASYINQSIAPGQQNELEFTLPE